MIIKLWNYETNLIQTTLFIIFFIHYFHSINNSQHFGCRMKLQWKKISIRGTKEKFDCCSGSRFGPVFAHSHPEGERHCRYIRYRSSRARIPILSLKSHSCLSARTVNRSCSPRNAQTGSGREEKEKREQRGGKEIWRDNDTMLEIVSTTIDRAATGFPGYHDDW